MIRVPVVGEANWIPTEIGRPLFGEVCLVKWIDPMAGLVQGLCRFLGPVQLECYELTSEHPEQGDWLLYDGGDDWMLASREPDAWAVIEVEW